MIAQTHNVSNQNPCGTSFASSDIDTSAVATDSPQSSAMSNPEGSDSADLSDYLNHLNNTSNIAHVVNARLGGEKELTTEEITKKQQFWQLGIEELMMLYRKKWITATAYVYSIVKILRQDGWWLKFETKAFALQYGIPQSTLYKAIVALASDPDIAFELSAKEIRVRFATKELKTSKSTDFPLSHSQQAPLISSMRMDSHRRESILADENGFSLSRMTSPETLTQSAAQCLTDIKQILNNSLPDNAQPSGSPLPHPARDEREGDFLQDNDKKPDWDAIASQCSTEQKAMLNEAIHNKVSQDLAFGAVDQNKDLASNETITHEGNIPAAPPPHVEVLTPKKAPVKKGKTDELDWLPSGPWKMEDGTLDEEFWIAVAQKWVDRYKDGDLSDKKCNVLKHFQGDYKKLEAEWRWYQEKFITHTANIKIRKDNDIDTTADEEKLKRQARAILSTGQRSVIPPLDPQKIIEDSMRHALPYIQPQGENKAIVEVTDFSLWSEAKHENYLLRLQNYGMEKFCVNETDRLWYFWAVTSYPQYFENIDIPA